MKSTVLDTRRNSSQTAHGTRWAIRPPRLGSIWLVFPAVAFLSVAFVLPLIALLSQSVYHDGFTFRYFEQILTTPGYRDVIWTSFKIALLSTGITITLAYPISCYLARVSPVTRSIMMALIVVPFWTNILARCYAWIVILQKGGLINALLIHQMGLISTPIDMLYNLPGVLIGMTHYVLPPAILILYSINHNIDVRLVGAARSLGASPFRAFRHVYFPLSLPGVRAATLLVMILSLGFFVTPALLGGLSDITLAMLIDTQFNETVNWNLGAALATLLLLMTLLGIAVYYQAVAKATQARMQ